MRYTRFRIENFRGIKSLALALDRQPQTHVHTLVGLNESGKSSILLALNWFRSPTAYDESDLMPKALRANFNGVISVSATLSMSDDDDREIGRVLSQHGYAKLSAIRELTIERKYTYVDSAVTQRQKLWSGVTPEVKKQKSRKRPSRLSANDTAWKALVEHIEERMLPPVVYYENFLFDIPDRIYLSWATGKMPPEQVQYREVVQDVLTSLGMGLTVDKHLVGRFDAGDASRSDLENIQAVLDRASGQLTEVVISAWRQIVKNSDQRLEVSLGNGLEQDEKGVFLQLKVKEGIHTFYIRERSLGFRWFFGFILFTHFRTYRDNARRNALFLLDEPASNLHPAAQTKLLSAFAALPNNQLVIYSTHSHHMINPEWLSGAYVVRNTGHSYEGLDLRYNASMTDVRAERYYQFAAHHPNETDLYRPILDVLEYRPGPLEMIPEIVVVEGKFDFYALRYMAAIQNATDRSPNVYPATGKDKVDAIVATYLGWGRRFVVLLDDDRGGRETQSRLVRRFGDVVRDRVLTFADIDPRWKNFQMEDMFEEGDRHAIANTTFPGASFEKGKFNTSLMRLFIEREKVALSIKTRNRFKKLLSVLHARVEIAYPASL